MSDPNIKSINDIIEALDESKLISYFDDITQELSNLTKAVDRVADELRKRK